MSALIALLKRDIQVAIRIGGGALIGVGILFSRKRSGDAAARSLAAIMAVSGPMSRCAAVVVMLGAIVALARTLA